MEDAVIVSAVRTAVGKAPRGTLSTVRPDEMAARVIAEALHRAGALDPALVDDVIVGCAMPEAEQGLNVARIASLRAGLPVECSAVTVNRFCASGLQAIASAAERLMLGQAEAAIAGGTESMSLIPMGGHKISPNPALVERYPDVYLTTGLVAENHARESGISREAQDAFAAESHRRAVAAIDAGRFAGEIVPLTVRLVDTTGRPDHASTKRRDTVSTDRRDIVSTERRDFSPGVRELTFDTDEGPRRDTSLEALAKLRAAFHAEGTVTAGNASQTSDGAAALVLTTAALARAQNLTPLARFVGYATAGVAPELFGLGPVPAIRKVLARTGLRLEQMDLVEFNEAFAAQVLACLKALPIDPNRLNVNGGAIALGHPLGCTGARLTTSLIHELHRRKGRYGLVTMCVGGGMGAAGIFERL